MPRLRRAAVNRRERPRLDRAVWQWLEAGRPDPDGTLPERTRWDVFVLDAIPVMKWHHGADDKIATFWRLVEEAVKVGTIEVADDVEHNFFDKPLVAEPDWRLKRRLRGERATATQHLAVIAKT